MQVDITNGLTASGLATPRASYARVPAGTLPNCAERPPSDLLEHYLLITAAPVAGGLVSEVSASLQGGLIVTASSQDSLPACMQAPIMIPAYDIVVLWTRNTGTRADHGTLLL